VNRTWRQLVVFHEAPQLYGEDIVWHIWRRALDLADNANLTGAFPTVSGEAHFHVRYSQDVHPDRGRSLELCRLGIHDRNSALPIEIADAAKECDTVICACWLPWSTGGRREEFLTFLQACTVLRLRDQIAHPRFLAGEGYAERKEAYLEMRKPGEPWSSPLFPWFEFLDASVPDEATRLEYGHWFGNIMSNRGLPILPRSVTT
jgi:hypothetical protein